MAVNVVRRVDQGVRLDVAVCGIEDVVDKAAPESVDVVFTSTPYKDKDGYSVALHEALGALCAKVLKPGGRLFFNFGQLSVDFGRPYEARDAVERGGAGKLSAGQTIAWVKSRAIPSWRDGALEIVSAALERDPLVDGAAADANARWHLRKLKDHLEGKGDLVQKGHYQPINSKSPTLNYCWETVYTFFKPPSGKLDRLAIGCPFTDKSNMDRGNRGQNGDLHCAGDIWWIPYRTTGAKAKKATAGLAHSYSFPEELVERALKLCEVGPGSMVCDPFLGGGTTAVVAKRLGCHTFGVELDQEAADVAVARWEEEKTNGGL